MTLIASYALQRVISASCARLAMFNLSYLLLSAWIYPHLATVSIHAKLMVVPPVKRRAPAHHATSLIA